MTEKLFHLGSQASLHKCSEDARTRRYRVVQFLQVSTVRGREASETGDAFCSSYCKLQ